MDNLDDWNEEDLQEAISKEELPTEYNEKSSALRAFSSREVDDSVRAFNNFFNNSRPY
jgi:hypothetical protein